MSIDWTSDFDLFDPGFIEDPFPIYRDLRERCRRAFEERLMGQVDRCLVAAAVFDITPVVILNKSDLIESSERADIDAIAATYATAGFGCHLVSVAKDDGLDAVRERVVGRVTALVGQSGVGKSSIVNAIQPGLDRVHDGHPDPRVLPPGSCVVPLFLHRLHIWPEWVEHEQGRPFLLKNG